MTKSTNDTKLSLCYLHNFLMEIKQQLIEIKREHANILKEVQNNIQ